MAGNRGGRPPKYTCKEEIEEKIEQYFQDCEGVFARDQNGDIIVTKFGPVYEKSPRPYTVSGLALALGFNSRQSLLNYQGKKEFRDTIERAKARIEQYTEERLFDRDGANGAKFSLQNNFKGWKDEKTVENTGAPVQIICDIPHPSTLADTPAEVTADDTATE